MDKEKALDILRDSGISNIILNHYGDTIISELAEALKPCGEMPADQQRCLHCDICKIKGDSARCPWPCSYYLTDTVKVVEIIRRKS